MRDTAAGSQTAASSRYRLPIPASARDLTTSGFFLQVDQRTFDASGGTCYDARIPGVGDLLLRFRSPDPTVGIADQGDGVLATVTIDAGVGSPRLTDAGFGLGTPEEQVRPTARPSRSCRTRS